MIPPVCLVGAGPGDPELITIAGMEALRRAEVVLSDRLVSADLRRLAESAEWIDVGKSADAPSHSQEAIDALMVERARQGYRVVRLKGGDPFVFGRGGEEASALAAASVPFRIIPGVTSAVAAAAAAGIAVTDRRASSALTIVTGSEGDGGAPPIDWRAVAAVGGTIVIMMGWRSLPRVIERLQEGGLSGQTPAAAIERATTSEQRTVFAPLDVLAQRAGDLSAPVTVVVGETVALASPPGKRPLDGLRVLVTRPKRQAEALSSRLRALGAQAIELPTIEVVPKDAATIAPALGDLQRGSYDIVGLTSVNGVETLWRSLRLQGLDARAFAHAKVAAIGRETARALADRGIVADVTPREYSSRALLAELTRPETRSDLKGQRVLLARAAQGSSLLSQGLREADAIVDDLALYDVVTPTPEPQSLAELERGVDLVTLTSPSAARGLVQIAGSRIDIHSIETVCIGPVTAEAARQLGLNVVAMADTYHMDGLVAAVLGYVTANDDSTR